MAFPQNIDRYLDENLYGWRDDTLNNIYPTDDFHEILTLRQQYNGGSRGVLGYLINLVEKLKPYAQDVFTESNRRIREAEREALHRELYGPFTEEPKPFYGPILTEGQVALKNNIANTRAAYAAAKAEEAALLAAENAKFSIFKPRTWCGKARCPRRGGSRRKARGKKTKKTRRSK